MESLTKTKSGQMILEALVGMAIISIVLVSLVGLGLRSVVIQREAKYLQQSAGLEEEAMEAVRQVRDGHGKIELDGTLYDWEWGNTNNLWAVETCGFSGPHRRYVICHHGVNTLIVPEPAYPRHIGHGDTDGPCPGDANPCGGYITYMRVYYDYTNSYWVLERRAESDLTDEIYRLSWSNQIHWFGIDGKGDFPSNPETTSFYRQIQIVDNENPLVSSEKIIRVYLSWKEGDKTKGSTIISILSDWN